MSLAIFEGECKNYKNLIRCSMHIENYLDNEILKGRRVKEPNGSKISTFHINWQNFNTSQQ